MTLPVWDLWRGLLPSGKGRCCCCWDAQKYWGVIYPRNGRRIGGGEGGGGVAQSIGDVISSDAVCAVLRKYLLSLGCVQVLSTATANVSSEETTAAAAVAVIAEPPLSLLSSDESSAVSSAFLSSDT